MTRQTAPVTSSAATGSTGSDGPERLTLPDPVPRRARRSGRLRQDQLGRGARTGRRRRLERPAARRRGRRRGRPRRRAPTPSPCSSNRRRAGRAAAHDRHRHPRPRRGPPHARGVTWRAPTGCPSSSSRSTPRPRSAGHATGLGPTRSRPTALNSQLRTWARPATCSATRDTTWSHPQPVRLVPAPFTGAPAAARRQEERPTGLRFGLHIGEFKPPAAPTTQTGCATSPAPPRRPGFDAIYVMDHFRQIPQVGRAWDDMLESWTTLAYLAACTDARPPRHARHRRHLPQRRAPRRRSSRPSTCSAGAARSAGWAWGGSSRSTRRTAGASHRPTSATRCSRTPSSCFR